VLYLGRGPEMVADRLRESFTGVEK